MRRRKQVTAEEYSNYCLCLLLFQFLGQNPDKSTVGKGELGLADSSRIQSTTMGKASNRAWGGLSCCRDSQKARTEEHCVQLSFPVLVNGTHIEWFFAHQLAQT